MTKVIVNDRTCCAQSSGTIIIQDDYDASSNLFPSPAYKGYWYRISVAGVLGGSPVTVGSKILKLNGTGSSPTDDQTLTNWDITY